MNVGSGKWKSLHPGAEPKGANASSASGMGSYFRLSIFFGSELIQSIQKSSKPIRLHQTSSMVKVLIKRELFPPDFFHDLWNLGVRCCAFRKPCWRCCGVTCRLSTTLAQNGVALSVRFFYHILGVLVVFFGYCHEWDMILELGHSCDECGIRKMEVSSSRC